MEAIKQALEFMPGLPSRDDAEVEELMQVIVRLPRENVAELARSVLRASLGYKRTGNPDYLTCLAEDTLVTVRLRRDPEVERALREAPTKPAGPEGSVDVEEMLRERGL